jgi:hypothetical protein
VFAKVPQTQFVHPMEQKMSKIYKINLIDVPWPINLLKCSMRTDAMRPGDELDVLLEDKEVKNSLILLLNALPELTFNVSTVGRCYSIHIKKHAAGISDKAAT